jgi:hypothetical protein
MIELKNNNTIVKVEIFDVVGKLCLTHNIQSTDQKIDVSNLQPGNYFLKAYSKSKELYLSKFVKE